MVFYGMFLDIPHNQFEWCYEGGVVYDACVLFDGVLSPLSCMPMTPTRVLHLWCWEFSKNNKVDWRDRPNSLYELVRIVLGWGGRGDRCYFLASAGLTHCKPLILLTCLPVICNNVAINRNNWVYSVEFEGLRCWLALGCRVAFRAGLLDWVDFPIGV